MWNILTSPPLDCERAGTFDSTTGEGAGDGSHVLDCTGDGGDGDGVLKDFVTSGMDAGGGALNDFVGAMEAGDGNDEAGVEVTGVGKEALEDWGPL